VLTPKLPTLGTFVNYFFMFGYWLISITAEEQMKRLSLLPTIWPSLNRRCVCPADGADIHDEHAARVNEQRGAYLLQRHHISGGCRAPVLNGTQMSPPALRQCAPFKCQRYEA
jgi:hypothetical protein